MSDTLLTYALSTDPDPLQAGHTDGSTSLATLTIVVSNDTHTLIDCQSITFTFPVGQNAKDLSNDMTGVVATHPPGWSLQRTGGVFTATPDTPEDGKIGAAGLAFIISNIEVNAQPGTFTLTISEEAGSPATTRTTAVELSKFPPNFTIGDFKAEPLSVSPDGETTLTWSCTSGATYKLEYNGTTITETEDEPPQPLPANGSYLVSGIEDDTTFNLIVTVGLDGQDAPLVLVRQLQVTVLRARISEFNADPLTLGKGESCTLWWETNADECSINAAQNIKDVLPKGSLTMTFDETTPVTLTAIIHGDQASEAQVTRTITVIPPIIKSFTATTATDMFDYSVEATLAWDTQYASSVSITPDVGAVSASGSTTVRTHNDTVYTLTCEGFGPDVTQEATVTVPSVEIQSFEADQTSVDPGKPVVLSFSVLRATSVSISPNGCYFDLPIGLSFPYTGNCPVMPIVETTYTLTCGGPNGPVTRSVKVGVNEPRIIKFEFGHANGKVTVNWDVQAAQRCSLTIPFPTGTGFVPEPWLMPTQGSYTYQNTDRPWKFTLIATSYNNHEVQATLDYEPGQ